MQEQSQRQDRDLVLPPNTFAYVLDSTKGRVSVAVGPYKSSLSSTDQLVVWDQAADRFTTVEAAEHAVKTFTKAVEGEYIILADPAKAPESHPPIGNSNDATDLDAGKKVIIAGPATFPLWPGQAAQVIAGHHLRHNQYVLVRVYQPDQAKIHWGRQIMAPQISQPPASSGEKEATTEFPPGEGEGENQQTPEPTSENAPRETAPREFTMGQLIVIKGTEVSFYIPSTGVEVVPEHATMMDSPLGISQQFVREAVTLERLEYCVLLDESGEKRYVKGPAVVFPEPTETFKTDEDGSRKFKAIELNDQSGLYVKVIAAYEDEDGTQHPLGEELFITGDKQAIYFPRAEHSIIMYDNQRKHHAIAIPAGEGRYVLNRESGKVDLIRGPKMFLPDPRTQVVVRRILDQKTVKVLYPGNSEAAEVNAQYEQEQASLEHGEFLASRGAAMKAVSATTPGSFAGDQIRRGTTYTPPRTIVLDTKYEGAVAVNVWPGYAVLVTDKLGNRRVEVGPANLLLNYDESLMTLELSTGRPKDDRRLLRTAYLRTINNAVSDQIEVETRDLVSVTLVLSYRVNFEGEGQERLKWFDVENYVKVLADHCRSRLRNAAKHRDIQTFYADAIDITRDALLGESENGERPGLPFKENRMRLFDVEVLNVEIRDSNVAGMLSQAKSTALEGAIALSEAETEAVREVRLEQLKRDSLEETERTAKAVSVALHDSLERALDERKHEVSNDLTVETEKQKLSEIAREERRAVEELMIDLLRKSNDADLDRVRAEAEQFVVRVKALEGNFVDALQTFGDKAFVEGLVKAMGPAALAAGITTADFLGQLFKGTPFEEILGVLSDRPHAGNGATSTATIER